MFIPARNSQLTTRSSSGECRRDYIVTKSVASEKRGRPIVIGSSISSLLSPDELFEFSSVRQDGADSTRTLGAWGSPPAPAEDAIACLGECSAGLHLDCNVSQPCLVAGTASTSRARKTRGRWNALLAKSKFCVVPPPRGAARMWVLARPAASAVAARLPGLTLCRAWRPAPRRGVATHKQERNECG